MEEEEVAAGAPAVAPAVAVAVVEGGVAWREGRLQRVAAAKAVLENLPVEELNEVRTMTAAVGPLERWLVAPRRRHDGWKFDVECFASAVPYDL